jgi:membrane peptidoglycan carboxypeptidase
VGNNDNSSTNKKTGIGLAAPIWRQIMLKLLQSNPIEHFTPPDPVQITNPYLAGQFPIQDPPHSALFYVDKSNPTGPAPTNPASDPLYYNWESAVSSFYGGANIAAQ